MDYKFLKKIISSAAAHRPASEAAALALGVRPADILASSSRSDNTEHVESQSIASILGEAPGQPPIQSASGQDDERGTDFQAHKAAFFFKLERELEKVWRHGTFECVSHIITFEIADQCFLPTKRNRAQNAVRDVALETQSCGHERGSGCCR